MTDTTPAVAGQASGSTVGAMGHTSGDAAVFAAGLAAADVTAAASRAVAWCVAHPQLSQSALWPLTDWATIHADALTGTVAGAELLRHLHQRAPGDGQRPVDLEPVVLEHLDVAGADTDVLRAHLPSRRILGELCRRAQISDHTTAVYLDVAVRTDGTSSGLSAGETLDLAVAACS